MNLKQKIKNKKKELLRNNEGKFRKLTIVEKCGKWTISWVILWSVLAGASWTNVIKNIKSEFEPHTTKIIIKPIYTKEEPKEAETGKIELTGENNEWKTGEFSAFTASVEETDSDPFTMASGNRVYVGAIACPNGFNVRGEQDRIEIKGMGIYTCEDRMNIRYRDKLNFDIFMKSKSEALKFGRRKLEFRKL